MAILEGSARKEFWSRPGTFAIVGGFEGPRKLSWMLLEQCQRVGIDAVPVNLDVNQVLGVEVAADPAEIPSLAGIVCVRLDPHATSSVEQAAKLGVPVWLSQGTVSDGANQAADEAGADVIAGSCPMLYLENLKFPHSLHRFIARVLGSM